MTSARPLDEAVASLRLRVDSLAAGPGLDDPQERADIETEAQRVAEGLRPLVAVVREFRSKWGPHRDKLLQARRREMEANFRNATKATLAKMQAAAEAGIAELRKREERKAAEASKLEVDKVCRPELRRLAATWRAAGGEGQGEVAVQQALDRVAASLLREDRRWHQKWDEASSSILRQVHQRDAEALEALAAASKARRGHVEESLQRHQSELKELLSGLQSQLAAAGEALKDGPALQGRAQKGPPLPDTLSSSSDRLAAARAQLYGATEAWAQKVKEQLGSKQAEETAKLTAFRELLEREKPAFLARLEANVKELSSYPSFHQAEDAEGTADGTSKIRSQQVSALRSKIASIEAAIAQGDWNTKWRDDVTQAAQAGQNTIDQVRSLLDHQVRVFRNHAAFEAMESVCSPSFAKLADGVKAYRSETAVGFERVCSSKAQHVQQQSAQLAKAIAKHNAFVADAENVLLPLLSQLAREVERCRQVKWGRISHNVPLHDASTADSSSKTVRLCMRRFVCVCLEIILQLQDRMKLPTDSHCHIASSFFGN